MLAERKLTPTFYKKKQIYYLHIVDIFNLGNLTHE